MNQDIVSHSYILLQGVYKGLTPIDRFLRILTDVTNIHVVQLLRAPAPDSRSHTHTTIDKV